MERDKTVKPTPAARGSKPEKGSGSLAEGRRVLEIEARAVEALIERLDDRFAKAVDVLARCKGKVVVSGMGKSGLIGQKIAATLASTGTSSFFLHPAEGVHGDLGMLARRDVLVTISNSGETQELLQLLPFVKRLGIPVIAFTGRVNSTLAKNSDVVLDVSVSEEACPMGLAPTASTTATLALGDALAVALLQKREFKEEDFARFHPGGTLGRRLLVNVKDLMHADAEIPVVQDSVGGMAAMLEMTAKKLGMTTVVDHEGLLVGVITDGDLRRVIQRGTDLVNTTARELATQNPKTIGPDELAAKAVEMMERFSITTLVVVEHERTVRGVVHLHDLLKNGIV
ncbi:MAG: KpsF/GutQ family sugar-phosphate isomerase [Nitrospira sp.]|nr:KpsF/GutQ family sugar-phosphate isomerase [Nitrospira sp.]MDH4369349.1 KpsF/GutQ family sugar-phosphate isomerase [Nitrospira sp.]MDH5497912.1 KpsF/GutQ family sugar-phosphate isomerase [Nitrospira sp.]MDH5725987.1 KpsF/GutQ family sugar-phosphate isomerase [Nitrospira sp.]